MTASKPGKPDLPRKLLLVRRVHQDGYVLMLEHDAQTHSYQLSVEDGEAVVVAILDAVTKRLGQTSTSTGGTPRRGGR